MKPIEITSGHSRGLSLISFMKRGLDLKWATCARSIEHCKFFVDRGLGQPVAGCDATPELPIRHFVDGECRPRPPAFAATPLPCRGTAKWYRCTTAGCSLLHVSPYSSQHPSLNSVQLLLATNVRGVPGRAG